jgi:hypothetical protein
MIVKLRSSTFKDFDENNDGIITKDEFEQGITNLKDSEDSDDQKN